MLANDGLKGDVNYPTGIDAAYTLPEGYKHIGGTQERGHPKQDIAVEHITFAQPSQARRGIHCFFCESPHFLSDFKNYTEKEREDIYPHGWIEAPAAAVAAASF